MSSFSFPDRLLESLRAARRVVALTGAGVSQESGLRTFRDAQTGIWTQHRPEDLASPEAFRRNPQLVWDWYAWRREAIKGVRPNPGHYALVEMEHRVPEFTLITQNVDGLHRAAGSRRVVEVHGTLARVRCTGCGKSEETDADLPELPKCGACGALLRPAVVWFHEMLPEAEWMEAALAAAACDAFLVVGTSAIVYPAAGLIDAARSAGAGVIEVNIEPTAAAGRGAIRLRGPSGVLLPRLVERLG